MTHPAFVGDAPRRPVPFFLYQAGADDIKKHKWFTTGSDATYWEDMLNRKIPPPIRPDVGSENDTANFE